VPILIVEEVKGPLQADFTEEALAVYRQLVGIVIVLQHIPLVIRTALRDARHARQEAIEGRACFGGLILQVTR